MMLTTSDATTGYDARFPQQNQYVFCSSTNTGFDTMLIPTSGPSTAGRITLTTTSVSTPRARISVHAVRYLIQFLE
jgi:hypothetical protein